jgi:hypothetical protein
MFCVAESCNLHVHLIHIFNFEVMKIDFNTEHFEIHFWSGELN